MLIESKIRRKNGTTVTIGKDEYHFAPGDDGLHVCEVQNPKHIQRFLSITEGYRIPGTVDDEPETETRTHEALEVEPEEGGDDIDALDLDGLEARFEALGKKMDRRRSLTRLRDELRTLEGSE